MVGKVCEVFWKIRYGVKYKIAIVEDEEQFQQLFSSYIKRFAKEKLLDIEVKIFSDGLEISEGYEPVWDGILFDIKMKNQDGMKAAKIVRAHDDKVTIMFITTLAQYAIHGYEVGAVDYVLKPVEYEKFALRFEKMIRNIKKEENETIFLPTEDGKDKVDISDITYITVSHHKLEIHVRKKDKTSKVYFVRNSLSVMEEQLAGKGFARCDHSAMVNLSLITSVKKDVVEVDGAILPISRSRKKTFLEAIADYHA